MLGNAAQRGVYHSGDNDLIKMLESRHTGSWVQGIGFICGYGVAQMDTMVYSNY